MKHCDGCTTPGTCNVHGCAVPTEAEKLARAKTAAHSALNAAEKAWHAYAALCDVGSERVRAFEVFENVRRARMV